MTLIGERSGGWSVAVFFAAASMGLASCGSNPFAPNPSDYVRTCTYDDGVRVVRVEDNRCRDDDRPHGGGYGWYYQQYPPRYDEDGYDQDSSVSVVDVGQPVNPGSGTRLPPGNLQTGRVGKAPTVLGPRSPSVGRSTTITRGGLGVSSARSGGS